VKLERALGIRRTTGDATENQGSRMQSKHAYFRPNGQPVAKARLVQE
jgi:hypothetical protein